MTFSYLVDVKRWINKTRKHSSPRAIHNIDQNIHNYKICRWWIRYVPNSYLWIQVRDWLTACHGVLTALLPSVVRNAKCQLTRVKRCRSKTPSFQPGRPTCHPVSWPLWLVNVDIIVVLCKMPHIFTNADMLYVYGFCDGSATAGVEEYNRRFPMRIIPDRRVFSRVFNIACMCPSVHVSSERARQQHVEEQEKILEMVPRSPTTSTRRHSARLGVSRTCVWRMICNGEHCMKTACTHFTHSVCKIYTQGAVSFV